MSDAGGAQSHAGRRTVVAASTSLRRNESLGGDSFVPLSVPSPLRFGAALDLALGEIPHVISSGSGNGNHIGLHPLRRLRVQQVHGRTDHVAQQQMRTSGRFGLAALAIWYVQLINKAMRRILRDAMSIDLGPLNIGVSVLVLGSATKAKCITEPFGAMQQSTANCARIISQVDTVLGGGDHVEWTSRVRKKKAEHPGRHELRVE